jgi:membrane carboxypeptidase/penicillin-binding protein
MALKITCPHCSRLHRLSQPYPVPGTELQCQCGRVLSVSYPRGMMDRLRDKGSAFVDPTAMGPHSIEPPAGTIPPQVKPGPTWGPTAPSAAPKIEMRKPRGDRPDSGHAPTPEPTQTFERTPAMPRPHKVQGTEKPQVAFLPPPSADSSSKTVGGPIKTTPPPARGGSPRPSQATDPAETESTSPLAPAPTPIRRGPSTTAPTLTVSPPRKPNPLIGAIRTAFGGKMGRIPLGASIRVLIGLGLLGAAIVGGCFWYFSVDLPTVEALGDYEPPTVTVVYDSKGEVLGEIYEKRRYVIPLEQVPEHVKNAFIASEDANFWSHSGVDVGGIIRAVIRNALKGKKAQGASTITQQVARNFLLTREKTYIRKIREIILAQRVEEVFEKEHILYLYLNQIYLGSGAYGVEAAARTYFDKTIADITLAEAAILAGLPQRPSDYSPHRHWKKARARQIYVLTQMEQKGFIDKATFDEAMGASVAISPKTDDFKEQAPHFTEHIRRYLVDTYGFDKIYNDGLTVHSTCDLDLQKAGQDALESGVTSSSNSRGWRGPRETLEEASITERLQANEEVLRLAESRKSLRVGSTEEGAENFGGYGPVPERSTLNTGLETEAVVLSVQRNYALVGIGANQAIIPLAWTKWAYEINPYLSYKYRAQKDMNAALKRGDVVDVEVITGDAKTEDDTKDFAMKVRGTVGAAKLLQSPELQGALFSYDVHTGAVKAMVGGVGFETSEYNRAIQSRRQVGSTFKPIVYGAAIGTKLFTAASILQDAPTVIGEAGGRMWKPSNYGGKYLGNITLRKALAMSRNVCTVRVLDTITPDTVYELAGPQMGIGYLEPTCSRTHISTEDTCVGERSASTVTGMVWCKHCDPTSCPTVRVDDAFGEECLDEPWEEDGSQWCHSCDVNIRVCDWYRESQMSSSMPCNGARKNRDGEVVCRVCDLSMGLGSSSLNMFELSRAYSVFATYGYRVEPYWIDKVVDRDGTIIEQHEIPKEHPQAMDSVAAFVTHWLLRAVAMNGTAAKSNALGIQVAGKTGTTNDYRDSWFVGYNPDVVTSVWVGFDRPKNMGQSFTGGDIALPIWMNYMRVAAPKETAPTFPSLPGVAWANIDESTGGVSVGGRSMPFLPGTIPSDEIGAVGKVTAQDLLTSDF